MGDFGNQLRDYLEKLSNLRRRGASEDSIRDAFLHFLRNAFPRLELTEPFLLERHIPGLRVRGEFADALYGDLIFEFKRRLDDQGRRDGIEELARYLRNQKEHPERFIGILTDGESLKVHALRDDQLKEIDQVRLDTARSDEVKLWLDCYLFHERSLTPTADDIALRFGERSPSFWHSLRILQGLWSRVGSEPAAQTKFAEWQNLLSIVYGSAVGDEVLFLRHTYLALFSRGLAYVALERRAPEAGDLLGIITGAAFASMGYENFGEDDFFTWSGPTEEALGFLQSLTARLTASYDLGEIHEDLLKELYQELVDPQTRHDLGEFYTPDWLAELTLREVGFPTSKKESSPPSLLDPSCGSGTFLFMAVKLLRESGLRGTQLVEFCTQHLAGLEVHPLAVTIAKTNFLLALGDDRRGRRGQIALPIFMADTLTCITSQSAQPEILVNVAIGEIANRCGKDKPRGLPTAFGLPAALARQPSVFHRALNALRELASPTLASEAALSGFRQRLASLAIPESQWHPWEANLDRMRWLLLPPATNGVWRFILRNAYQPRLLVARKFTFVVGNPPWLAYRYIKRRDFQERIRLLAFEYGLLDRRSANLFTQMELATVFFAVCAERYLAEGGALAFIMPRSILTGSKQHAAFRRRYVAGARRIIDCEQVVPLFRVPACVILWTKPGRFSAAGVRMLQLRGRLPARNPSLAEAKTALQRSETRFTTPAASEASPYLPDVIQGATLVPRSLWFVRSPSRAHVIDPERSALESDPSVEPRAKKPWKGLRLAGSVEAEYLFATLLSNDLLPFGWRRLSRVVLPLEWDGDRSALLTSVEAAYQRGHAGLGQWLRNAEAVWGSHQKVGERVQTIYDRLDFGGCLTRQRPSGVAKLVYNRSGTHLCASVVDPAVDLALPVDRLRARGFVADNGTYWFETENLDEAHYLCAVLNAPKVDQAIKPYQTKGTFGAAGGRGERDIHRRPFEVLPIPRYSRREADHRELAKLSRRCHEIVGGAAEKASGQWLGEPIGRLRTRIRTELIHGNLDQINGLVAHSLRLGEHP
jgi:hypothetical protein